MAQAADGTPGSSNSVEINGPYIVGVSDGGADLSVANLTITNGGSITVNPGKTLSVSGSLTINSNALGDGSLINNGTITGTAIVERYLPGASWHLASTSVASANSSVYTGLYMKQYDETLIGPEIEATNLALIPETGAVLWATKASTLSYNGSLNNGTVGPLTCTHNNNGYNLMGNPYPLAIDWNASGWTKNNLASTIWGWGSEISRPVRYI